MIWYSPPGSKYQDIHKDMIFSLFWISVVSVKRSRLSCCLNFPDYQLTKLKTTSVKLKEKQLSPNNSTSLRVTSDTVDSPDTVNALETLASGTWTLSAHWCILGWLKNDKTLFHWSMISTYKNQFNNLALVSVVEKYLSITKYCDNHNHNFALCTVHLLEARV